MPKELKASNSGSMPMQEVVYQQHNRSSIRTSTARQNDIQQSRYQTGTGNSGMWRQGSSRYNGTGIVEADKVHIGATNFSQEALGDNTITA